MVAAGCMALCTAIDTPACEAQDNYRGVGGDGMALFLPSPQIFGWWQRSGHPHSASAVQGAAALGWFGESLQTKSKVEKAQCWRMCGTDEQL